MAYQIADKINGPFGETVNTLAEAEILLAECIEEGKKLNRENSQDGSELGSDGSTAESFFYIVDAESGEEAHTAGDGIMSNKLFSVLDGIIDSDHASESLASVEAVQEYAFGGMDMVLSDEEAARIVEVGRKWVGEMEKGNGEWSRMRHEAMAALSDDE